VKESGGSKVQGEHTASRILALLNLREFHKPFAIGELIPRKILFSEITRAKPSLETLGIKISVFLRENTGERQW
jgi:hypothetical protein